MALIIATAPGRCGILGNPSDMYGGSVISSTTLERAECRIDLDAEQTTLSNAGKHAVVGGRADLALRGDHLDIARAALTIFEIDPADLRIGIHLRTDIPMRAGMAGSTALLASLVGALGETLGRTMSRYHLAEATRKVEWRVMGVVCGLQDQHMAVFGGLNFMDFRGKEELEQSDVEPLATVESLSAEGCEPPLLLAHTGIEHHSGQVHTSPRQRWLAGDPLVRANYARIAELAVRGKRAMIEQDWPAVGALMNENHRLVSEIADQGEANERLIEVARKAGAWGAKLAGAGGGGTIIALTADPERVGAALLAAGADCLLTPRAQPGLTVTRID